MEGENLPIPVVRQPQDDAASHISEAHNPSLPRHGSRPTLNFSRPRPAGNSNHNQPALQRDTSINKSYNNVHHLQAFRDSNARLFDSPSSASLDAIDSTGWPGRASAAGEFTWDPTAGELVTKVSKRQLHGPDGDARHDFVQRVPSEDCVRDSSGTRAAIKVSSASSQRQQPYVAELPAEVPGVSPELRPKVASNHYRVSSGQQQQQQPRSILKRTISTDQQSSNRSSSSLGETSGSHHTVSATSSVTPDEAEDGEWTSSEFDISGMSEEQKRKLEKKGVNPRLYAEMKASRKRKSGGRKWVGALAGNSFLG